MQVVECIGFLDEVPALKLWYQAHWLLSLCLDGSTFTDFCKSRRIRMLIYCMQSLLTAPARLADGAATSNPIVLELAEHYRIQARLTCWYTYNFWSDICEGRLTYKESIIPIISHKSEHFIVYPKQICLDLFGCRMGSDGNCFSFLFRVHGIRRV